MKYLIIPILCAVVFASCDPATAFNVNDATLPTHLEIPAYTADEDIYAYSGFTSSYNHTTLVPNWVAYELTADELNGSYDTKSSSFSRDPNVRGRQASREDYSRSGWDKGHMAPKADLRWSETAYWESHYFTNVCPQNHQMNAGDWNTLEKSVRRWARKYGTLWIVCGPIFDEHRFGTIGAAKVQVPDAFFKAVLMRDAGGFHSVAFVMPNTPEHHPMSAYVCTVDDLEALIGRDLFPNLPDAVEAQAESTYQQPLWF